MALKPSTLDQSTFDVSSAFPSPPAHCFPLTAHSPFFPSCHLPHVPFHFLAWSDPLAPKFDPRNFLLPVVGLILIAVLFIPQVEELLGEGFDWTVGALGLAVAVLIVRFVIRKYPVEKEPETLLPIYVHDDEERERFRAMCGVKERPESKPSMKVVTPPTGDAAPPGNPARNS